MNVLHSVSEAGSQTPYPQVHLPLQNETRCAGLSFWETTREERCKTKRRISPPQAATLPRNPGGNPQRGSQPPFGRFKGFAKGEYGIPLCRPLVTFPRGKVTPPGEGAPAAADAPPRRGALPSISKSNTLRWASILFGRGLHFISPCAVKLCGAF